MQSLYTLTQKRSNERLEMGCNHQIGDSECEHHHTYLEFLLAVSYNWLQYQTPFFRQDCIFHHSDQKVYFRTKNQYSNFHPICHENSNVWKKAKINLKWKSPCGIVVASLFTFPSWEPLYDCKAASKNCYKWLVAKSMASLLILKYTYTQMWSKGQHPESHELFTIAPVSTFIHERFWKHLSFKKYFNLIKPMLCMCNTYVTFWVG